MRKVLGWVAVAIGAIVFVLFAQTVARVASMLVRAGPAPAPATVAAAPPDTWVRLTDAVLRCDTRKVVGGATVFLARDAGGGHPFVADFAGDVSCAAAQADVNGTFLAEAVDPAKLASAGLDVGGEKELRLLSQALRPDSLRVALRRGIAWLLAAALLVVAGVLVLRRQARAAQA